MGKTILYGITDPPHQSGLQAYAIDSITGEIVSSHFCSSEIFAKSDLGFTDSCDESSNSFNMKVHEEYKAKYPKGYELVWIGDYTGDKRITRLMKPIWTDENNIRR